MRSAHGEGETWYGLYEYGYTLGRYGPRVRACPHYGPALGDLGGLVLSGTFHAPKRPTAPNVPTDSTPSLSFGST